MNFEWMKATLVHPHWAECEQMMIAENRYGYLVGRENEQWFAMHQDRTRLQEYWLRYADSREDAKKLAEAHARGKMQ